MERAASSWRRSPGHSPCRWRYLYLPAVVWGTPQSCSGRTDCRNAAALTRRGVLQLMGGGIRIAAALTGGGAGASTTGKRDTRIRSPLPPPLSPLPPLRQSPLPLPPLPLQLLPLPLPPLPPMSLQLLPLQPPRRAVAAQATADIGVGRAPAGGAGTSCALGRRPLPRVAAAGSQAGVRRGGWALWTATPRRDHSLANQKGPSILHS